MKTLIAQKIGGSDECYTPKYAITPLLPYLRQGSKIWECAVGTGELKRHFEEEGFIVEGGGKTFLQMK